MTDQQIIDSAREWLKKHKPVYAGANNAMGEGVFVIGRLMEYLVRQQKEIAAANDALADLLGNDIDKYAAGQQSMRGLMLKQIDEWQAVYERLGTSGEYLAIRGFLIKTREVVERSGPSVEPLPFEQLLWERRTLRDMLYRLRHRLGDLPMFTEKDDFLLNLLKEAIVVLDKIPER